MTSDEYKAAADRIAATVPVVTDLKAKYAPLEPHFAEVDALDEQGRKLDEVVDRLDAYSRDLEAQFHEHFRGAPPRTGRTAAEAEADTGAGASPSSSSAAAAAAEADGGDAAAKQ